MLSKYLLASPSFKSRYEMVEVPPVQLCDKEKGIDDLLPGCDLFIYQIVGETYGRKLATDTILSKLPSTCETISIPNTYFTGYHPQHAGLNPVVKPNIKYSRAQGGLFLHGDKNIIKMLNEGKCKEEIIRLLSDINYYSYDEVMKNFELTINELRHREAQLNVSVTDFIVSNYQDKYLFYTINHPAFYISRYVAQEILKLLNINQNEIESVVIDDFMNHLHIPIYPRVIHHLGLKFIKPDHKYSFYYYLDKRRVTFEEYLSEYIDHAIS